MTEGAFKPGRVQRQLTGEPMTIGGRTLQPVASVAGWVGESGNEDGRGGGGFVSIKPVQVIVRHPDDREERVPIPDATSAALKGILFAALVGPLLWLVVRLLVRWVGTRTGDAP